MDVYLASTLSNAPRVREIRDRLVAIGAVVTYDWTTHNGGQQLYVPDPPGKRIVANLEFTGIAKAKCLLAIMPGAMGTHFELGAAYVLGKPIVILYDTPESKTARWPAFHHLEGIVHTNWVEAAIDATIAFLKGKRRVHYPLLEEVKKCLTL
jgi:nucleoside 2-deoxyribosyltransferase